MFRNEQSAVPAPQPQATCSFSGCRSEPNSFSMSISLVLYFPFYVLLIHFQFHISMPLLSKPAITPCPACKKAGIEPPAMVTFLS